MINICNIQISNGIISTNTYIQIEDEIYDIPKYVQTALPKVNYTDNGNIYINGYKFNKKKKKFERTIFSYLKCLFA